MWPRAFPKIETHSHHRKRYGVGRTGLPHCVGSKIKPIVLSRSTEVLQVKRVKLIYLIYRLFTRCQTLGHVPETDIFPIVIEIYYAYLYFIHANRSVQLFLSQTLILFFKIYFKVSVVSSHTFTGVLHMLQYTVVL